MTTHSLIFAVITLLGLPGIGVAIAAYDDWKAGR